MMPVASSAFNMPSSSIQNEKIGGVFKKSPLAQQHIKMQRELAAETDKQDTYSIKKVTYKLALASGSLAFPAIACIFLWRRGWIVPVSLVSFSILAFIVAGRKTPQMEAESRAAAQKNQEDLPI
jgi:hypothetical protein